MTKLTTKRFTVPVVIALAIAMVSTGAQAAKVDPQITEGAVQAAIASNIEDIGANVAVVYGDKMASGEIKLNTKNVGTLGTLIANNIASKDQTPTENNLTNKADEIAEFAAVLVARLSTSTNTKKFDKKTAPKVVLALVKGIFKTTKVIAGLPAASSPNYFQDVVGSVLYTAIQAPGTDSKADDKIYKLLKKNSKKLAGKENATAIKTGLEEAKLNDTIASLKYENGGIDRVSEVFGGVSWLISWPRKKPIKI